MKKILYCMLIGAAVLSALPSCATVKTPGDAPLTLVTVRQGKVQGTLENGSPTEILAAWEAGADAVKVFPASSVGPGYIKAIRGPLSHIPLMAVGGVNEKNAADFMKAGCVGLGVGGNLVNKEWIKNGEWDKITALAREFMTAVKEA